MTKSDVNILLVDDDDVDAEAIERAFRKHKINNPITVARNGLEALDVLRGTASIKPIDRPYLILLDLNMPRMTGLEFLRELRREADLRDSIIFVLTTSNSDQDKIAAYEHHVAGYMVKQQAGEDFQRLIGMLDHYWKVVEFPPAR